MIEISNEFGDEVPSRRHTALPTTKMQMMPMCNDKLIENHFHSRAQEIPGLARFSAACKATEDRSMKGIYGESLKPPVVKSYEGFLEKRAHQWLIGWQKRKVVVGDRKLKYYKKDTKGVNKGMYTKLRGVIDFDLLSCKLLVESGDKPKRFQLEILANKRSFSFRCKSYEDLRTWVRVIHAEIEKSKGDKSDLTKVAIQRKFWRVSLCVDLTVQSML